MRDAILVLNAGSSSLKFSAFLVGNGGRRLAHGQIAGIGAAVRFTASWGDESEAEEHAFADDQPDHGEALAIILDHCRSRLGGERLIAVGHRVVHGGVEFAAPVRIDDDVLAKLDRLAPLAPLHQPHNLAAVRAVARLAPHLPQVACFDTAFHRTQPEVAQRFGLPRRFTDDGVLRYGFHGLSYEYIASVLPRYDPEAASSRTVVAHLGNGASLCALHGGRSVATTMGFTPADGLLMGTRCGSLDPGAVLYMMAHYGLSVREMEHLIDCESGLLGVSGMSADMRVLLASADPRAAEAVDLFVYRVGLELGSMAAALGGVSALVFTGGIGENAAAIRARICRDAAWLGVDLDIGANESGRPRITQAGSRVAAWVIPTDEESIIADHTRRVLGLTGVAP